MFLQISHANLQSGHIEKEKSNIQGVPKKHPTSKIDC